MVRQMAAIAALLGYVFFMVALVFALLIAGVDFTGLAIIAGALSVGIGLGLQDVVNNFVSGIILLIERPIKPGDRIIVGGTEGIVKEVRIRATQIRTLNREDVIVPNSALITQQITNFMFHDQFWRIICGIGVAYGSDIELVKEVLLKIAHDHPSVIQEAPNKPTVLFRNFGESSLDFELRCIIRDVNQKNGIHSDLNFKIAKAFDEHNIEMPFPQRDLHIIDCPADFCQGDKKED